MRDLVVREALIAMARDAAKCLHGLIAAGEEVPYEVREPGDGSPLCRYEPLSERFVRDHAGALHELESFGVACAALESSGLAGVYLEQMGIDPPPEPRRRSELAALAFLCRLWMQSTDFTLDDVRLEAAISELEQGGEAELGQIEVIVPLRGLQMPISSLDLGAAAIVRADTVEVPAEARAAEGLGGSPWEPAFLAVVRIAETDDDADPGATAVGAFRRLITTLRLFKVGGVGLGPHAWTRSAGDRWRRIATGAGRPRPGGYRLLETELGELSAFSRTLGAAGTPFSRQAADRPGFPVVLGRATARFEAGLERNVVIEALNDHLLALRFLLEGDGPAGLGLSMRVAALCAEPDDRGEVKAVVDRAIGLERELWSGEPAGRSGVVSPAETAAEVEDLLRAILKDAAAGHLGADLRGTADEILLADGFAVGDGPPEQRGTTTEWDLDPVATDDDSGFAEEVSELDRRISPEPVPEPQEQTVIARAREIFTPRQQAETEQLEAVPTITTGEPDQAIGDRSPAPSDAGPNPVLRLIEQTRAEREARRDRIAGLFPRPETTEWSVSEIAYDRTRRARVNT